MLFDENNIVNDRLKIKNESLLENYITINDINDSIKRLNEEFYELSKESIIKESFSKITNASNSFKNEAVDEFLKKFNKSVDTNTSTLDDTFKKFINSMDIIFKNDKKFLDKYKDSFMAMPNKPILVTNYVIIPEIPNFKVLNDIQDSFNIDIRKIDENLVQRYRKNDKYFDFIRGKILLQNNKPIKEEQFRDCCYRIYRGGNSNPIKIELNSEFKLNMIKTIYNYKDDLKILENDLNKIKGFIKLIMKNTMQQFKYVSKYENLSNYEYDMYTSFIYNEMNELRLVIKQFEIAFSYKMDAVKSRRNEYFEIIKKMIKGSDVLTEDSIPNFNEDYNIDNLYLEEELFKNEKALLCTELTQEMFNEDLLIDEAFDGAKEALKELGKKLREMIRSIREKFSRKNEEKLFDKKTKGIDKKALFTICDSKDIKDFNVAVFTYDTKKMLTTISRMKDVNSYGDRIEEMMKDIHKFRKETFTEFKYNGNSDEEWKNAILTFYRGNKQSNNPKNTIIKAFNYRDNATKVKKQIIDGSVKIERMAQALEREINKAQQTITTNDEKKTDSNGTIVAKVKNESFNMYLEADANKTNPLDELHKANKEFMKKSEKSNKKASKEINKNKVDTESATDRIDKKDNLSPKTKAMNTYIKELLKVHGYIMAAFEEGIMEYASYVADFIVYSVDNRFLRFEKETTDYENSQNEKLNKEAESQKSESAYLLESMTFIDDLKEQVDFYCNKEINENVLLNTLIDIAESNNIMDEIQENYIDYNTNYDKLERYQERYTNYFSAKLKPYINDKNSLLYK